jgi:hypothetical protein
VKDEKTKKMRRRVLDEEVKDEDEKVWVKLVD